MLGGGNFTAQTKILPGAYINFVSKSADTNTLGERGVVAMPIALTWGKSGEVFAITAEEFQKNSVSILGYSYSEDAMLPFREVFKNAKKVLVYNLTSGGVAAKCTNATAKFAGTRGNDLKLVIQKNVDDESLFDVTLYLGTAIVDQQTVASVADLKENDFVTWGTTALAVTAGTAFTGGTDGTADTASWQSALDIYESQNFNTLAWSATDETIRNLGVEYTKRLRDKVGKKFQLVAVDVDADYEGVVSLVAEQSDAIYWAAGALAGCAINKSCTNMTYDGEIAIAANYTQAELEQFIMNGKFVFHQVEDETRVLTDINTLVSYTTEKGKDFASNQVIRVIDQCGNDTARKFNNKYVGKIQNDQAGRTSFWNDVLSHRRELETMRAIETYDSGTLVVSKGNDKYSVVVTEELVPVGAMEKLYMTTVIN